MFYQIFEFIEMLEGECDGKDTRMQMFKHSQYNTDARHTVLGIASVMGGQDAHDYILKLLDSKEPGLTHAYTVMCLPLKHCPQQ
jgi:hypothetical protein